MALFEAPFVAMRRVVCLLNSFIWTCCASVTHPSGRKPVVEQPEIVLTRGMPLVIGKATHSKTLSASFLADLQEDYELYGKGIFALMRERFPTKYFDALVSLAKVHRIELGPPGSFDRPASTAEALDRLEQRAGPQARTMLEQFLEQVKEVEANYREEESAD